jgi:DNA polymerase-3 subunit delta
MRISYASFPQQLKQGLTPIYLLFGAETLLVEELLDLLRQQARAEGFTERLRYSVEAGFEWNKLFEGGQSMSLFSEKKLIELRIPTGKPGDAGAKALVEYAETSQSPDTTLVVIAGGIEKRAQNSKWFKSLESQAVITECPTIGPDKLSDWIGHRMRSQGLAFEPDVVPRLAHFVEGNLHAAAQEINLLALLANGEKITPGLVESSIADHARFNAFNFVDACLAGTAHRATRILQSLKQEQVEPILILWSLTRETRTLCRLAALQEQGVNPRSQFQRLGVWGVRTGIVGAALRRLSLGQCQKLLRRLARADLQLKGRTPLQRKNIWEEIESIGLGLCGLRIP